jgi:hypothetical protein
MTFVVTQPFDMKLVPVDPKLGGFWRQFKTGEIFIVVDAKRDGGGSILMTVLHPELGLCVRHTHENGFRSVQWALCVSPLSLPPSP